MAYYSALIAHTENTNTIFSNPGVLDTVPNGAGSNPGPVSGGVSAYTRVSPIVAPHFIVQDPGGFISADFLIPAANAAPALTSLRFGAWCWMFDGRTPIFYGKIDSQPKPATNGDVAVSLSGSWMLLYTTRFREAWDDPDMSKWTACHLNDHSPSIEITGQDRLRIMWPQGTVLANGNRAQVDYLLFNEEQGTRDLKEITAFDVSCSDDNAIGAAINFRLYGRNTIVGGTEDQLVGVTVAAGSFTRKQGSVADSWPTADYRIIRLGMQAVAANTIGADRFLVFDRIRIGTREPFLTTFGSPPDSSDIAADLLGNYEDHGSSHEEIAWDIPPDFWRYSSAVTAPLTKYGSDPVVRGVVASGVGVDSVTFTDWTAPADALAALTTIDGCKCGLYFPTAPHTGWWKSTDLPWCQQMPTLTYEPWSDISAPDYQVSIRRGAEPEMDDSPQPLISTLYVNYQKTNGRQFSLVVSDFSTENYLFANGMHRAEDYEIEAPVSATTATSLANQVLSLRRQPLAVGLVRVYANRVGSITDGGGAIVPRLSLIRPGVVQITDLPRTQYNTGRCTQVEWFGETLDDPERVELTLEHPGQVNLSRRLAALASQAQSTVSVKGGNRKKR